MQFAPSSDFAALEGGGKVRPTSTTRCCWPWDEGRARFTFLYIILDSSLKPHSKCGVLGSIDAMREMLQGLYFQGSGKWIQQLPRVPLRLRCGLRASFTLANTVIHCYTLLAIDLLVHVLPLLASSSAPIGIATEPA